MSLLDIGFMGGESSFCTAMGEGGYAMLVFDGGDVPQGARPSRVPHHVSFSPFALFQGECRPRRPPLSSIPFFLFFLMSASVCVSGLPRVDVAVDDYLSTLYSTHKDGASDLRTVGDKFEDENLGLLMPRPGGKRHPLYEVIYRGMLRCDLASPDGATDAGFFRLACARAVCGRGQ
jgi:hypothetical protein